MTSVFSVVQDFGFDLFPVVQDFDFGFDSMHDQTANNRPATFPLAIFLGFAAVKILIYIFTAGRYGYFRDELYFLATGRHLAAGYVDMAPLTAFYARIGLLLGGSLHAIRLIPALAGIGIIALTMHITRQLGGGRFAQIFAGFCILISPVFLEYPVILSMNAIEPLFWMGCISVLIAIINTGDSRLWIWFGVLAGLGLENKHSTAFFGLAVVIALLLTEYRREFLEPWIWIAGGVALLIFLPNLIWQYQHRFPTLEDLENVRKSGKNVVLGPTAFIGQQISSFHPITLPIWLGGLIWLFRTRKYRVLGWTFVIFFAIMFAMKAKDYYLFPIYPMLFAAAAVPIERWLSARTQSTRLWLKATIFAVLLLATLPILPMVLPILSPENYLAYMKRLHMAPEKTEVNHEGPLPQLYGDQFGWEELVGQVADIYNSLPPEERARTGILASNYGEAGAIDMFGPKHGLPSAISGHQNYYYWGTHGFNGDNLIIMQWSREHAERLCNNVEERAVHFHPFGMEEENNPIYLCRGLKVPLDQFWPKIKHWN